MKTILLADGSFPVNPVPLSHLAEAEMIVCCDGAAEKLERYGRIPDAIVGDLDSISDSLKEKYSDRLFPDDDQDTNDLTKAVKWCVANEITEVVIIGATGIREDHTLGNISLLADYSSMINAIMLTDTGSFRVYDRSVIIASHPGQQVSLFSIDNKLKITSTGLRYPLNNLALGSWWRGTLNEAVGESFSLSFSDGQVIVFLKYPELSRDGAE
ncbi:MAG: thiamine diphosphokinase [Bacteroidales bacterium]|jgi:thiamine pyrophosphokinase|nr:thiamine diphosphokinase [Bacteroidales bacterium]